MAFKRNIRRFGQQHGRAGTKFVRGVRKISNQSKLVRYK